MKTEIASGERGTGKTAVVISLVHKASRMVVNTLVEQSHVT